MTAEQRPAGDVAIVECSGSHRLVAWDGRFAVLEYRNGRIYPLASGDRPGFPDTAGGIVAAVGAAWSDEAAARRLFDEIRQRGETLAQRIW